MATNKVIKGLTVQIGGDTTQLGKALEDVNKKSSSLSGELRDINKLLKFDPGNADLLTQKHKVLTDAVATTKKRLDTLREAERQVQEQFAKGKASADQVRALKREIIEAENKLNGYKSAAKETKDAIKKLGKESEDAAEDVEDLADKQEEAERSAEDLDDASIGLSKGFAAVAAAAAAAAAAVVGIVESTKEYRTAMGKLDAAFESSGHSTETAKEAYKELNSIIGETDQSVEAAQQIALLADSHKEVTKWADLAAGVVGKFGDALQPETFYEAANETLKLGEATGAYTQMLEGVGINVEDFNEELAKCNTTEKKQALLLKTSEKALGSARDAYKKNNKAIIEANEASEEWNETLADIGDEMQPVVTDIKKMGTELLKSAKEPLKLVATFIADKVIPALTSISKWVMNNLPLIKAGLVAFTAGFVAYKIAVLATTVAQTGLVGAIKSTTAAQTALNLVQKASPWGLVAAGVTALVAGLIAYGTSLGDSAEKVDILTKEERELMEAANETAESFREQQAATENTLGGINSQYEHVQKLANELKRLADENGRVQESDESRVQFILNEMNEALGTEYSMVDGVIQQYGKLKQNIDEVIESKKANALLEAANADYIAAIQAEDEAFQNLSLAEKDYQNQLTISQAADQAYADAYEEYQKKVAEAKTEADYRKLSSEGEYVSGLALKAKEEKDLLAEKQTAYDEAAANYGNYKDVILGYEEAQQAVLEGNYDRAVEILRGKSGAYDTYADHVDKATREAIDALYKEAVDAGIEAERTRENFEKGIKGYTKEMVDEAEQGYNDALDAWATAKADAEGVGENLGEGAAAGLESKKQSFITKAKNFISASIKAMKEAADENSPSKATMEIAEFMGEGAQIGLEKTTDDFVDTAEKQVKSVLDAYSDAGDQSQTLFRNLDSRRAARQTESLATMSDGTATKLDKILAAIEKGQVLTIDGEKFVGGTYDSYDKKLGQKRNLVARGAL